MSDLLCDLGQCSLARKFWAAVGAASVAFIPRLCHLVVILVHPISFPVCALKEDFDTRDIMSQE